MDAEAVKNQRDDLQRIGTRFILQALRNSKMKVIVVMLVVMCSLVGLGLSTSATNSSSTINQFGFISGTSGALATIFTSPGGNILLFLTVPMVLFVQALMK
ncbi:uncharacterized [Tachysurus ichikawai]